MPIQSLSTPSNNARVIKSRSYLTFKIQWLPWNATDGIKEKLQVATVTESTTMWDGMDCTAESSPGVLVIDGLVADLLNLTNYPNAVDAWWEPYGDGSMAKLYQEEISIGSYADYP